MMNLSPLSPGVAIPLPPSVRVRASPTAAVDPQLAEALRTKLLILLQGDPGLPGSFLEVDAATVAPYKPKRGKKLVKPPPPVTLAMLLEIEQTARLGRELLALGPSAMETRDPSCGPVVTGAPVSYGPGYTNLPFQNSETFGATSIRELMASIKSLRGDDKTDKTDPVKLVEAIAVAKERGLDTVATALERRLLEMEPPKALPPKKDKP
jgi:hypothetical protein